MPLEALHLTPDDARLVPWKNGRGVTRELALWPEDAREDWAWRLSRALVDAAGPFSAFPGCERVLTVTSGPGLVLAHGAAAPRARLRPLEPYRFSGEWATTAELVGGPVEDFNVITRVGRARAEVEVLRLGARRARAALGAGQAYAHVLGAGLEARVTGEEEAFALGADDSLWVRGARGGEELDLVGRGAACVVLLVRLEDERA